MAKQHLFRTTAVTQIDAHVKPNNVASIQLFSRAGYAREKDEMIRGHQAVHFVLKRTACGEQQDNMDLVGLCSAGKTE
jgi:RimJ/RimL family protein N-acetyltransferase